MPNSLSQVSLLFVKQSRLGPGKVNASCLVMITVQASWRGSVALSHGLVLLVWLRGVDVAAQYNVQILVEGKQKHFAVHAKAKTWSLDARAVSWVFLLGELLWHFCFPSWGWLSWKKKFGCTAWARQNLKISGVNRQLEDADLPQHLGIMSPTEASVFTIVYTRPRTS